MRNVSRETKHWAHWSRTFAVHGGIGVVPLTPETQRFPNGFVMYDQGAEPSIILRPTDPNVRRRFAAGARNVRVGLPTWDAAVDKMAAALKRMTDNG